MISPDDVQQIQLVNFSGGITYNTSGFAVLPSYNVVNILASVQPLSSSEIRFLPEGTHYADFINIFTDYAVDVDNSPTNLGDYFIWQNNVYKVFSAQNYQNFSNYSTNHIATTVARDNRITWNGSSLNIPFPEIDSAYGSLFDFIKMVTFSIQSTSIPVLWGFQQELRPNFPYCMVNIESIENKEGTDHREIDTGTGFQYKSASKTLTVNFHFYAYDKIQALSLMEEFKLNREDFVWTGPWIGFAGFSGEDLLNQELYENRSIFHGEVRMLFNWVVQNTFSSSQTINEASFTLSSS